MLGVEQHLLRNRIWGGGAGVGAVAELTIVVASPCPGVSIRVDGQGMKVSGADLCGFQHRACMLGVEQHLLRNRIRGVRAVVIAVAELAIVVVSPCPGVSIRVDSQRKPPSGADLYGFQPCALIIGAGGVAHAHRNRIHTLAAGGVVAELAIIVVSPGVYVSVAAYGQ